jgi:hypothetical protein
MILIYVVTENVHKAKRNSGRDAGKETGLDKLPEDYVISIRVQQGVGQNRKVVANVWNLRGVRLFGNSTVVHRLHPRTSRERLNSGNIFISLNFALVIPFVI